MNILLIGAILLIASPSTDFQLTKDQQVAALNEAQTAYDNGVSLQTVDPVAAKESFRRSANRFQLLVNDGVENGRLWYNLGNANLQADEIGEAIAAYRLAQRYIPSDGRVAANLQYARSLVRNPIEARNSKTIWKRLAFWHRALPTKVRLIFGIICWFSFWGLIITRIYTTIAGFKTASIGLGCFAIALGISVGADIVHEHQDQGVLTTNEVILRKGNGTNYAPTFKQPIHEGIEFEIIEQRPNWLHIMLPNGSKGWIHEEDAQVVTVDIDHIKNAHL
ncbi:MAG: hypothetical protein QGF07_00980 [Phycisphaerales bacterium]|jgi:hypothetical protein|nr:hypothetical protein [Phycisphaerales bacterium]